MKNYAILGLMLTGLWSQGAMAVNCYIMIHGRQDVTDSYTSYQAARNYWVGQNTNMFNMGSGSTYDGVQAVTKNFAHKYYVVGYDGTKGYQTAAVQVAKHLGNALQLDSKNTFYSSTTGWSGGHAFGGGKDGGGNSCAGATRYILVAHSMGGTILDFILGNARTTDPNYNFQGAPFGAIGAKLVSTGSVAYTLSSPHRGAQAADAIEGKDSWFANLIASFISKSTDSTVWLQTAANRQVAAYSANPIIPINLLAGHESMASSIAINGDDDGVISTNSSFACSGDPLASRSVDGICSNGAKMKLAGFYNRSSADENHSDVRNGSDTDKRVYPADGKKCVSRTCKTTLLGITLSSYPCSNSLEEVSCETP